MPTLDELIAGLRGDIAGINFAWGRLPSAPESVPKTGDIFEDAQPPATREEVLNSLQFHAQRILDATNP